MRGSARRPPLSSLLPSGTGPRSRGPGAGRPKLMLELRLQPLEPLDRAAPAHPRVDRVAAGAQSVILGLQVEAGVEIEGRAVLVQLGSNAAAVGEDEVDFLPARKHRPADGLGGHALRPLMLFPRDFRQ